MKKVLRLLVLTVLVVSVMPVVLALSVGVNSTPDIGTLDFAPMVWQCDSRVVLDDSTAPGRVFPSARSCSLGVGVCSNPIWTTQAECEAEGICEDFDLNVLLAFENNQSECESWGVCSGQPANPKTQFPDSSSCTNPANYVSNVFTSAGNTWTTTTDQTSCEGEGGIWTMEAPLVERINNYAFEGEQVQWIVLVNDQNGITTVTDVVGTVGSVVGAGNDIEVTCTELLGYDPDGDGTVDDSCNARIDGEELAPELFNPDSMKYYTCTLTVETPLSMYGEYWITVEAIDLDLLSGVMDENEYWFFNPVIALTIDGDLIFEDVRPGTMAYSTTLTIGNDADPESGVILDMFISGTDFYDLSSSGAMCPSTNQLLLGDDDSNCDVGTDFSIITNDVGDGLDDTDPFCYFATNGAYSTRDDLRSDSEGYVGIRYGIGFNDPNPFYGTGPSDSTGFEILQDPGTFIDPYWPTNILAPGAEMSITLRLALPEPCNGDFDSGDISFWGEAI